jgi:hypothetical protein
LTAGQGGRKIALFHQRPCQTSPLQ